METNHASVRTQGTPNQYVGAKTTRPQKNRAAPSAVKDEKLSVAAATRTRAQGCQLRETIRNGRNEHERRKHAHGLDEVGLRTFCAAMKWRQPRAG